MRAPDDYTERDHKDWVQAQADYESQMHGFTKCDTTATNTKITVTDEKLPTNAGSENTTSESSGNVPPADGTTKHPVTITSGFHVKSVGLEPETLANPTLAEKLTLLWYRVRFPSKFKHVQSKLRELKPEWPQRNIDYLTPCLVDLINVLHRD